MSSNEQHLFEIEIFCDTNVFTVTFDLLKSNFLSLSLCLSKWKYSFLYNISLLITSFLTVVYVSDQTH